ncbi:hypothetical protein JCM15519_14780 [Fundidesulfovibrio butyratiphilus]
MGAIQIGDVLGDVETMALAVEHGLSAIGGMEGSSQEPGRRARSRSFGSVARRVREGKREKKAARFRAAAKS